MRTRAGSGFTTIRTEGGLVPPELLGRVAAGDPELEGIDSAAYHLAAGERRNEAINRAWSRLTGAWAAFRDELAGLTDDDPATSVTRQRWSLVLFQELAYGQLQPAKTIELDHRTFPVSHAWESVPIHLVGAHIDLDRRTEGVAGAARTSPHGLVQELLNASHERLWGFVSNGLLLRLLRDNVSLTRQAFVEFDLEAMFDGDVYADFVVLWLLCHQSRLEGEPPEKCILERWMTDAAQRGTRALDQLRDGVESAITALGGGFLRHPQNVALRERLRDGSLTTQDYYRQLLRLVYRLLFVFVAEDRDLLLVPETDATTRDRYQRYYSTSRVRRLALARRGGIHGDIWESLRLVFGALGADDGLPALGLPGLGSFLWSERAAPDLQDARLSNQALLDAIRGLTTVRDGKMTRSVDYRNLGSEELGGIYESLLELHPELNPETGSFALRVAMGNERKTTGSYYTPTILINELLDSALEPVLERAAAQPNPEDAVLDLRVLDPACGSGHFLIAAAHRIAGRLAGLRVGHAEASPQEVRRALRDVIGRCIHGIDMNEMAVELCKVSLWMEAVEPGRPLSFLEHRIVCGNALLGATPRLLSDGVPDDAFQALAGEDKNAVKALKARNKRERKGQGVLAFGGGVADLARPVADAISRIDALDDVSPGGLQEKERQWAELQRSDLAARATLAADAWCAAFVAPKYPGDVGITDGVVRQLAEAPDGAGAEVVEAVRKLALEFQFLHFHIAFPDVFSVQDGSLSTPTGWAGGFDIVLGNPPWERVKLIEREFFAQHPEIASATSAAKRKRLIADLEASDPPLYRSYQRAARHAEGVSHFIRNSGRFPLCGRGDVNTYAVFAECFRDAVAPQGRCGVVVPTGIATDDTTKYFFGDISESGALVSIFDFVNTAGYFPGIGHGRQKFSLLTLAGRGSMIDKPEFAFFCDTTADLHDPQRRYHLSKDDIALLNPNTRTCPVFRTSRDADLNRTIYRRVPPLVREHPAESPWQASFLSMFHMSNDSFLFRSAEDLVAEGYEPHGFRFEHPDAPTYLPLFEGKMFFIFQSRFGDYAMRAPGSQDTELPLIDAGALTNPTYAPQPLHWVPQSAVDKRLGDAGIDAGWLLAFRDVTNANSERTFVVSAVPRTAIGNNAPLLVSGESEASVAVDLLGCLSSFAFDYLARQKINAAHANFFIVKQFPVIPPERFGEGCPWDPSASIHAWLVPRLVELTFTGWDLASFGAAVECPAPYRWDEERRPVLAAELDACFFHLYEIDRADLDYVMETFPIVKRKDEAENGEYRTKRLILERFDAMAKAIETGEPYETILDPPPADPSLCHPEATRPDWAKLDA